jgi:hypothetical protein
MTHKIEDQNRRAINFATDKVRELLPEYFVQDYPSLVSFLENYYTHLNNEVDDSFKSDINSLVAIRDISQTSLDNLDNLITEIGNGLQVSSFFQEPRLMARLLASFYRSKGSLLSVEGFFRAFFNEEVTVEYPKDQIFIVGESEIGYESQKFIQDAELYQIFSILLKVGLAVSEYESLYKRFVHPAGFYFAGQVQTEQEVILGLVGSGEDPLEAEEQLILASTASLETQGSFSELTALLDSDGTDIRIKLNQTINVYQDLTTQELDNFYDNIAQILTPNSFTMDDDSAGGARPDTSITLETMDNSMFTRYTSDSAI